MNELVSLRVGEAKVRVPGKERLGTIGLAGQRNMGRFRKNTAVLASGPPSGDNPNRPTNRAAVSEVYLIFSRDWSIT